jgi:uncharacterized protein (DUF983 family)
MFGGLLTMNDRCSVCGHQFMREEGFFQGAMYVSYVVGVLEFAVIALVAYLWLSRWLGVALALTLAVVVHLALVPLLFQYSRVIWAHVNVGTGAKPSGSMHDA